MLILENSEDREICFTNLGDAKKYYYMSNDCMYEMTRGFSIMQAQQYCNLVRDRNDDIASARSLNDLASVLNLYSDDLDNGSMYSVREI